MYTENALLPLALVVWGVWWLETVLTYMVRPAYLHTYAVAWWAWRWGWRIGVLMWALQRFPALSERLFLSIPESPRDMIFVVLLTFVYIGVTLAAWALVRPRLAPSNQPYPDLPYVSLPFFLAEAFSQQATYALVRTAATDARTAWAVIALVGLSLLPVGWIAHRRGHPWPQMTEGWAWLGAIGGTGLMMSTRFFWTAVVWEWFVRLATYRPDGVRGASGPEG